MFRRVGMLALCVVFVIVCCSRSFCAETNDELAATVSATLHDETENSARPRIPDALLTFMRAQEPSAVVQYSATDTSEARGTEPQSLEPATFADGPRVFARQSLQSAAPAAMSGFAPNPSGQNLAPLAMATADSYWWELSGGYGYPPSADKAIDGLLQRGWESRYGGGHWFSLNWPQPVKINRIFIYRGWPFYPWVAETISQVYYLDVPTGMWKALLSSPLINGGTVPASDFSPVVTDVSFPFIETTSLYFPIQTGPVSPHPNGAVAINEIEVYGSSQEVLSVTSIPPTLYIDEAGAGSGILFKATTSEAGPVSFAVVSPSGDRYELGSDDSEIMSGGHIALKTWWGNGRATPTGTWQVIAEAGGSSKTATFQVERVSGSSLGMGEWMKGKDPSAIAPSSPPPVNCPSLPWPALVPSLQGHFSGITIQDPVNIAFGTFVWPEVDLTLKSNRSLVAARIYNSLDPHVGPFGLGWSSPYTSRLQIASDAVVFVNSDGGRLLFDASGSAYLTPAGSVLRLRHEDSGFWSVWHPNGPTWTYDEDGQLIRQVDACCGQGAATAVTLTYENHRLRRVENNAGQWLEYSTNAAGKITSIVDSTGRTLEFAYDGELLKSVTDPMGRITSYRYGEDGFLTGITKPGNRLTTVTYHERRVETITAPNGGISRFSWSNSPRKLTLTSTNGVDHEYGFDETGRFNQYSIPMLGITEEYESRGSALSGMTDSLGGHAAFAYRGDGLLEGMTNAMGSQETYTWHPELHRLTSKTDALGRTWQYNWCVRGNLIAETDPAGGVISYGYNAFNNRVSKIDQLGRTTRYTYSPDGAYLVSITDANGGVSSFSHDLRGNLLSSTDPLGRTTRFAFDQLDRLTKTVYPDGRFSEIEYDEAGNVAVRRDNLGRETRYSYNLGNQIIALTRPDGTGFTYSYNTEGQKLAETDALGRVTRFAYSLIGLLTKITYPDGAEESFSYDTESHLVSKTNELGQTSNLEYDQLGRLLATIDPTGARWESQYDAAGRKIVDKDPLGRISTYQLDNLDRITNVIRPDNSRVTNSFDAVGNLLNTVDALGNQWTWVYDNLNRQVKAIQPNSASSRTNFDAAGQVISETDALNRTTLCSFDSGGRKTATTDALGNVWLNSYDTAGRLISTQDPMGATVSMTYDLMDRVISQSDPLGNVNSFEFDAAGRRVARTDPEGRRFISVYDLRDRVISEVDAEGHTVSYGYNLAGQRVSLTDGANRVWRWEFDSLGRVVSEVDPLGNTTRTDFDAVGNRVAVTNARNQTTTFLFDTMNRLSQVTYPDGTLATMAHDLEGRELVRSGPTGSVVKTWDSVGNLTTETFGPWGKKWQYGFDLVGNRVSATDPEGGIYLYTFDKLNRLEQLDPPETGNEVKYTFDAVGRLITEERSGVKTVNAFDAAGRLLELKHERGSGTVVALCRYTYSPVGNRLTMTDENGGVTRYSYTGSDWLTKIIYPDGQQVSYSYNGAGDRLSETTETPTVKKVGKNSVIGTDTVVIPLAYDAGGRLISKASDTFDFDSDGNQVAAVENGDETRFMWSADNLLTNVEKDLPCSKHGKKKCGQCSPVITAEEYSYLPQDWRRVTRSVFTHDGQRCKHGYGYGHGRGHVCDEIPGHGNGHDRDSQNDEAVYVSVYDNQDESHEYLLKADDRDVHNQRHEQHKCTADQQKPSLELVRSFIGGPSTDDLEYTRQDHRSLTMLKDALGSTIALTVSDGRPLARIGYDVWGNLRWPDKPGHSLKPCDDKDVPDWLDRFENGRSFGGGIDPWHFGRHHGKAITPYLYTGRRLDQFAGQYFNRNRYYNPKVSRFTSKDPIGFSGGNNLWGYGNQNPIRYTDPFGQTVEEAVVSLEEAAVAAGKDGGQLYSNWATNLAAVAPPSQRDLYSLAVVSDIVQRVYYILDVEVNPCVRPLLKEAITQIMCGQSQHAISKRIYNEGLAGFTQLKSFYTPRDFRFIAKAVENGHVGYADWHRSLDDEMIKFINERGTTLSPPEFGTYLRNRYSQPDLTARFPFGFRNLQYWVKGSNPDNDDER